MSSTNTTPTNHCENCGSTADEDLYYGDQGYTACCNEPVCTGGYSARYGTETDNVRACCWAEATKTFKSQGRQAPEGSYQVGR